MNASATQIKVGDKAIFCSSDKAPVETTIVRVTPKGWIRIAARDSVSYKPSWGDKYEVSDKYDNTTVYLHSDAKMAEVTAEHERYLQGRAEQQAARDKQRQERDARLAAETAKVKELCENDLATVIHSKITLPNGDRLVTMFAPVNPQYADRKAGRQEHDKDRKAVATEPFEVVICRLVNRNEKDWLTDSTEPRVESYMTYCNGGNQSFPSCSGDQQKTDEDCLWEALRHVYHSW